MTKVSVCIPTYNHEQFIAQALESVLAQRGEFELEVVIAEDASSDSTRRVCESFVSKHPATVRMLPAAANRGFYANWRAALASATGDFVAVLDGDDYYAAADKLAIQLAVMAEVAGAMASFHPVIRMKGDVPEHDESPQLQNGVRFREFELCEWPHVSPATSSLLFRRSVVEDALGERYSEIPMSEWLLLFAARSLGKVVEIAGHLSVYRQHDRGFWTSGSVASKYSHFLHFAGAALQFGLVNSQERAHVRAVLDYCLVKFAQFTPDPDRFEMEVAKLVDLEKVPASTNAWAMNAAIAGTLHLRRECDAIRRSATFRIGRLIVLPLKWLKGRVANGSLTQLKGQARAFE